MACLPGSEVANLLTAVAVFVILGAYVCVFHFAVQPFQRDFFCNDESISYRYKPDTVTMAVAALVGASIILLTVLIVEIVRHALRSGCRASQSDRTYATCLANCGLKPESGCTRATVAIARGLLLAALGSLFTEVVTVTIKIIIGRHRPHFLAVCHANISSAQYIAICAAHLPMNPGQFCRPQDLKQYRESMLSFPSGHSSHSMYMTLFAALYLQSRFTFSKGHAVKWLLQCFVLVWGLAVCASRVSDYKHHWSDVVGGGIIGVVVALLVSLYLRPSYAGACGGCGALANASNDGGCDFEAGGGANNNNGDRIDVELDSPRNNMNEMGLLSQRRSP